MRSNSDHLTEYRVRKGHFATPDSWGLTGAFWLPDGTKQKWRYWLFCIASDGSEWPFDPPAWEHVSVTYWKAPKGQPPWSMDTKLINAGTPTWGQMSRVRSEFFRPSETVLQFHVPDSDHVNYHEHCLHLWRCIDAEIPRPPNATVGPTRREAGPVR